MKNLEIELLEYTKNQAEHCELMANQYKVDTYSKDGKMTDEQMSGYYQGRGEANHAIKTFIEDKKALAKESTRAEIGDTLEKKT
jgi:hypothetical protein